MKKVLTFVLVCLLLAYGCGGDNGKGGIAPEGNLAPVLEEIGPQEVDEGGTLAFNITATDPEGDTLTYSSPDPPDGLNVDPATGAVSWIPGYDQAGAYSVTFTVTDDGSPPADTSEIVTITVNNTNRPPVLDAVGDKSIAENQPLTITLSATDPDGDALTYSAGNRPTGSDFDEATGTFTWTPSYEQAASYPDVVFTATDNGTPPKSAFEAITITVGDVNRRPILDPIGSQGVSEGKALSFTVTATDPDSGQALTLSASNVPTGADFNEDTGEFVWVTGFEDAGTYPNVLFTVTDNGVPPASASEEITIAVGDVNRPPELTPIGSKEILENEPLTITPAATDSDAGQTLTYTVSNRPPGADFDGTTFTWTPSYEQAGIWPVLFTVIDDGWLPQGDFEQVIITVGDVNRLPVLDPIGPKTIPEEVELAFAVTATDPDGDNVTISASGELASFFNPATQQFAWTPTYEDAGNHTVTFTATDDGVPPESTSETVNVTVGNVNRAPELNPIGNPTVDEGETLTITLVANDPDNDPLTYSVDLPPELPVEAVWDADAHTLTWTPSYEDAGEYPGLTFSVSDGDLSVSETITITVVDVNPPPALDFIPDQSIPEGQPLAFTIHATDPESDPVTYGTVDPLPVGATLDPDTGDFAWTPDYDQADIYPVTFTASDGTSTTSQAVTITVTDVNQAPVLTLEPAGPITVAEGEPVQITATGTDPDLDTVTLSADLAELPAGDASFDEATGVFTWAPATGDAPGSYPVTFTATDDGDPQLSDVKTISITVTTAAP